MASKFDNSKTIIFNFIIFQFILEIHFFHPFTLLLCKYFIQGSQKGLKNWCGYLTEAGISITPGDTEVQMVSYNVNSFVSSTTYRRASLRTSISNFYTKKSPEYIKSFTIKKIIFICENNRKSIKIMHCVDFFWSGSFEDMDIYHVFQLSFDEGGGLYRPITDR